MPVVLVVDDEESVHRMVAAYLHEHRLVHAYNGWQAAWALAQNAVDLVLLDLNLPGTSGLDLLKEIVLVVNEPPVLMFSADLSVASAREARIRGAVGFVPKTAENYRALSDHVVGALAERRAEKKSTL